MYHEEVVIYEVAIPKSKVDLLREKVCGLGRRLSQLAMYFDAPAPSVEIIELLDRPDAAASTGGSTDEPGPQKATRRRGKKDRPEG
jgi:hypothetical protein